MKGVSLLFVALLVSLQASSGQSGGVKNNFERATEAFENGQYTLADSLFSVCVGNSTHSDFYFNRAQVRRVLSDTCGFCYDLKLASEYFGDKEAENQYVQDCLHIIDTTFFTKDHVKVSRDEKYRFYQVLTQPVCDTLTYISFHDKKGKVRLGFINMDNLSSALIPESFYSDIIGKAYLRDTIKYFYYIRDQTNEKTLEKGKARVYDFARSLGKKYEALKESKYELIHVLFKLSINNNGRIIEAQVIDSELNTSGIISNKELTSELSDFFQNSIVLNPVRFQNQSVFYETFYLFDF